MSYIPDTDQSFHIRREFSISEAKVCDRNHKRKENDGNELNFTCIRYLTLSPEKRKELTFCCFFGLKSIRY